MVEELGTEGRRAPLNDAAVVIAGACGFVVQ
jgi:hypothetical protein